MTISVNTGGCKCSYDWQQESAEGVGATETSDFLICVITQPVSRFDNNTRICILVAESPIVNQSALVPLSTFDGLAGVEDV